MTHSRTPIRWRRTFVRFAAVCGVLYVLALTAAWHWQADLTYLRAQGGPIAAPAGVRMLTLSAHDGQAIPSWYLTAARDDLRDPPGRGPTIVLYHSNGATRADVIDAANHFRQLGFNVMVPEYRGFGDAPGDPTEGDLVADGLAAYDLAAAQPETDPSRMVLVGFSLGTGVAVRVGLERPAVAVSIWAPYTSLPDVAWHELPIVPYHALMHEVLDTESVVAALHHPLQVVEGTADALIPNEQSEAVYAMAAEPAGLVRIDGADHVPTYWAAVGNGDVDRFLVDHARPDRADDTTSGAQPPPTVAPA